MAFCIWFSSLSVFSRVTHVTADINTSFLYVPEEYFRVHLDIYFIYTFLSPFIQSGLFLLFLLLGIIAHSVQDFV